MLFKSRGIRHVQCLKTLMNLQFSAVLCSALRWQRAAIISGANPFIDEACAAWLKHTEAQFSLRTAETFINPRQSPTKEACYTTSHLLICIIPTGRQRALRIDDQLPNGGAALLFARVRHKSCSQLSQRGSQPRVEAAHVAACTQRCAHALHEQQQLVAPPSHSEKCLLHG